jgi:hypothetical protein
MPVWRCPHCATPQAEASRCWVCRRSTTSCVTCRHYRRGLSGSLGLCALEPRNAPVANTDVRGCWVAAEASGEPVAEPQADAASAGRRSAGSRAPRTFVPVESLAGGRDTGAVALLERPGADEAASRPAIEAVAVMERSTTPPEPVRPVPGRWWLWGDPDPWPERLGERLI